MKTRSSLACLLACLATTVACAGADDVSVNTNDLSPVDPVSAEENEALDSTHPFNQPPGSPPLVCGQITREDLSGEPYIQRELYYLDAINRALSDSDVLRELTGLTTAESCDDARLFSQAERTLLEIEEAGRTEEVPEPEVEKLWRGVAVNNKKAIQIGKGGCSAFAFGRSVWQGIPMIDIITAAHCVTPTSGNPVSTQFFTSSNGVGSPLGEAVSLGWWGMHVGIHPDFTGTPHGPDTIDPHDDIAVVRVERLSLTDSYMNRLYVGSISTSSTGMAALGWGNNSQNLPAPNPSVLRTGYKSGGFLADWVGSKHFLDNNDGHVSLCKGDSGGPAYLSTGDLAVVGIASTSNFAPPDNQCRTDLNSKQKWTRISAKVGWIQQVRGNCTAPSNNSIRCW